MALTEPVGLCFLVRRFFIVNAVKIGSNRQYSSHEFGVLSAVNHRPLSGDRQPECFASFQEL